MSSETCPADQPVSSPAPNPASPSDFCCQSHAFCLSTEIGTAAIYCASDQIYDYTSPIHCNSSLQDASENKSSIFATDLYQDLAACEDGYCPFGYSSNQVNGYAICIHDNSNAVISRTSSAAIMVSPTQSSNRGNISDDESNFNILISQGILPTVAIEGVLPGISVVSIVSSALRKRRFTRSGNQ